MRSPGPVRNPDKPYTRNRIRLRGCFLGLAMFLAGCAYFNTFYNARQYFDAAEKARLANVGNKLPATVLEDYSKVIAKAQIVVKKYPQSKYRYEAILLMGIAHFYRQEIRQAESTFRLLQSEGGGKYQLEARYWLALCKWKLGTPTPAQTDLQELAQQTTDNDFKARIYLSQAEILLEQAQNEAAFENLEKAADITSDSDQRSQIYFSIGDLAFKQNDLKKALRAYKQVLKFTTSSTREQEARLQIMRIYRLQGNWRELRSQVRSLLADERYKKIYGEAEIELARMHEAMEDYELAQAQFDSITTIYAKSLPAAEAYFRLGDIALSRQRHFALAREHYGKVSKEARQSPYSSEAQGRLKEITAYLTARETLINTLNSLYKLQNTEEDTTQPDSTGSATGQDPAGLVEAIAKQLYTLAELDAFHFRRPDTAVTMLEDLVWNYPGTELQSKALFTLGQLYAREGRDSSAQAVQDTLLKYFPKSEYVQYLARSRENAAVPPPMLEILVQAETEWLQDPRQALQTYKRILKNDSLSSVSAQAAYFLAWHYDNKFNQADSALKYYRWLHTFHPESGQAQSCRERYQAVSSAVARSSETISDSLETRVSVSLDSVESRIPTEITPAKPPQEPRSQDADRKGTDRVQP